MATINENKNIISKTKLNVENMVTYNDKLNFLSDDQNVSDINFINFSIYPTPAEISAMLAVALEEVKQEAEEFSEEADKAAKDILDIGKLSEGIGDITRRVDSVMGKIRDKLPDDIKKREPDLSKLPGGEDRKKAEEAHKKYNEQLLSLRQNIEKNISGG